MELQGYSAVDASAISLEDIRKCTFKIAFATAEMVRKKPFMEILKTRVLLFTRTSLLLWSMNHTQ